MKDNVKVSVVQFAPDWLNPEHNAERMASFSEEEANRGADLILFPELSNLGYISPSHGLELDFAMRYAALAETIPGPTTRLLGEVAERRGLHIVVGMAERHPTITGVLWNSAVLIGPSGKILQVQHKVHIPAGEKHYFSPGSGFAVTETELGRIALSVCYDGRFPESSRVMALKGAEIVCSLWARHGVPGQVNAEAGHHLAFVRAHESSLFYLFCNRVGTENGNAFLGHSAIGAPNGELLAASPTSDEEVIRADLRGETIASARTYFSLYRDRRPDTYDILAEPIG